MGQVLPKLLINGRETMPKQFPIVTPHEQSPLFDNLDQAAHEVCAGFDKKSKVEQSAALFKRADGKYAYSAPVTNEDHDNFGMRVQLPKGVMLAGVVHSHLGTDELGQYFSPNDISIAHQLNVPSYICFARDNSVRRYTPGQTSTFNLRGYGTHVSKGDPLNLPDISTPLANLNARAQALTDQLPAIQQLQQPAQQVP